MRLRNSICRVFLASIALSSLAAHSHAQLTGFNFAAPTRETAPSGYIDRYRFANVATGLDFLIDVHSASHPVAYTSAPSSSAPAGYLVGVVGNDLSIRLYNGDVAIGQYINMRASIVDTGTSTLATPINFFLGTADYDWNATYYRERARFWGPEGFCVSNNPYSEMAVTDLGGGGWEAKANAAYDVSPSDQQRWAFFQWGATNQFDLSWAWDGLYGTSGQITTSRFLQLDGFATQPGGSDFTNAPIIVNPAAPFVGAPEPGSIALLGLLGGPMGFFLRRRI